MFTMKLEELKKLIRKVEFNKTEPELLINLISKAAVEGEKERERLKRIRRKAHKLYEVLKDKGLIRKIDLKEPINDLKSVPLGSVDGSFQVVGGIGGKWYAIYGVSQVIAKNGFTLRPIIKVDGSIEPIEAIDEGEARKKAEVLMMLGEIKSLRKIAEILESYKESYIIIDGPIIDPPLYADEEYIKYRIEALRFCYERNVNVVGFVKRIMGSCYLRWLREILKKDKITDFINDLDLLSAVMFEAIREFSCPTYTRTISYDDCMDKRDRLTQTYKLYRDHGLIIYYSYYKPNLRGRIFRIEYASFKKLSEQDRLKKFNLIFKLINRVWTLPGMDEPLPVKIAHIKCRVRRGAAELLYHEILSRTLSEGLPQF